MCRHTLLHGLAYVLFLVHCFIPTRAQQTFFPASVPLAVRSPYLFTYISTQNGTLHSDHWPRNLALPNLGWTCLVKVDNGTTYLWSGDTRTVPGTNDTTLKQLTVTPTRTIFTLQAGPLELNITYLSPIEPDDFVKQSIPFSYLAFEARSTDGSPHRMQVYTGITDEWLAADHAQNHTWATAQTTNGSQIHSFSYSIPREFTQNSGLASWGTPYYATRQGAGVTYRIGMSEPNPALFLSQGSLDNSVDPGAPRIIQGGNTSFTSLTFAHDLGTIESTSAPVVWAIGHTFDSDSTSAVQYQDLSGNPAQRRSMYYVTQYSDDHTLIDDFLNDFPAALERSIKLDANLTNAAASRVPGSEYSDLIALATRQVMGSTSLTISKGSYGSWNKSDVMMFWRDLGNGPPDQISPPDGLFTTFPMFLYLNPSFGAPLLEPLLRFQASPAYTNPYAAANIGVGPWPNMTANNSLHNQGIEQSANMIILSYAQARGTGDTSLVGRYYQLLKSWTDYLISPTVSTTTVFNNGQLSADGLSIANQTNLAIKGIIAIKAMSMIASLTGNTADATTYSDKSRDFYVQWKSHALAEDGHMLLAYGADSSSFSLGYNVFADLWLGTGVVDSDVTSGLSRQVNNLFSFSPGNTQFGVAMDSTVLDRIRPDWNMFVAATVNDSKTRSSMVSRIHARASLNTTDAAQFPLEWSSTNLTTLFGGGTPRQGAVFAPLVLTGSVATASSGAADDSASSRSPVAAIAGGVIGGVLGSVALVGFALYLRRHHQRSRRARVIDRSSFSGERSMQIMNETSPFVVQSPFAMQEDHLRVASTGDSAVTYLSPSSTTMLLPSETSQDRPTPPASVSANQTRALSPKELLELRHATRAGSSPSVSRDGHNIPPMVMSNSANTVSEGDADARIEELRREFQALRQRVEPPPSYVDG